MALLYRQSYLGPVISSGGGGGGGGGGAMVGVTFQAIDGGSTYFSSFTYASNAGWDAATFYPVGCYSSTFTSIPGNITLYQNLKLNFAANMSSDSNTTAVRAAGNIWVIVSLEKPVITDPIGTETVGIIPSDEPQYYKNPSPSPTTLSYIYDYINTTANAVQDPRFWWNQNTSAWVAQDSGGLAQSSSPPSPGTPTAIISTKIPTPNATTRFMDDTQSFDYYWISASRTTPPFVSGTQYGTSSLTTDQGARGSHYGDYVDLQRLINNNAGRNVPIGQIVENGGPFTGGNPQPTTFCYISAPELDWADWSTIIHGGRMITYFNASFSGPDPESFNIERGVYYQTTQTCSFTGSITTNVLTVTAVSSGNIPMGSVISGGTTAANTVVLNQLTDTSGGVGPGNKGTYTVSVSQSASSTTATQTGQPIQGGVPTSCAAYSTSTYSVGSIVAQMQATGVLISTLAPVINSQFALGYATASPAGYLFPNTQMSLSTGIDLMVKKYTGTGYTTSGSTLNNTDTISTNTFYIFAGTRAGSLALNTSATFTIADKGATSVTVINEGRTIAVSGGQFTDTFAYAWTTHIYKVTGPQTGPATPTTKTIFLTTTTPWTVPPDWNPANANSFELIGGGGGGGASFGGSSFAGAGGGGGEYQKVVNQGSSIFQAGDSITIQIGAAGVGGPSANTAGTAGTATFIKDRTGAVTVCSASGGSGGGGGSTGAGGAGGTGGSPGTTHNNGGVGGNSFVGTFGPGGGGGAAGPNGVGAAGGSCTIASSTNLGGAGGGGNGGGTAGVNSAAISAIGFSGGMNSAGYGAGAGAPPQINGPNGFWGGGGGGGGQSAASSPGGPGVAGNGGTGGTGIEWTSTLGVVAGSGGGGGAGGGPADNANNHPGAGGAGGNYGGGGGGGSRNNTYGAAGGNGAPGIIVITYQP